MTSVRWRAGVIVIGDDAVALIERHRAGRHYWVVPGGGVEPGETVAEAAVREAGEELGVPTTLGPVLVRLHGPDGDGAPSRHVYFRASVASTAIRVRGPEADGPSSSGSHEAVWVPLDEVPGLDVRPPEVAELIVRHGVDPWPPGLVIGADDPGEARGRPVSDRVPYPRKG